MTLVLKIREINIISETIEEVVVFVRNLRITLSTHCVDFFVINNRVGFFAINDYFDFKKMRRLSH